MKNLFFFHEFEHTDRQAISGLYYNFADIYHMIKSTS